MSTRLLLVLLLLLPATSSLAFEDLGLRPRWDDPARRQQALEMGPRLDRIDEIEATLPTATPAESESLLVELIRLYRSSPLMKHRILALGWSDSLPSPRRLEEQTLTYRQTFNPWNARRAIQKAVDERPSSAIPHRWLGIHRLEEGLREPRFLDESLEAFEAASRCADATIDDWLGMAAVHLLRADYHGLAAIADGLLAATDDRPGPYLLAAIAHEATGLPSRAAQEFQIALDRMSPRMRSRFDFPKPMLVRPDDSVYGNTLVEAPEPPPVRGWWVRLTEAETLFSDPDHERHSWETGPGQVYLLFGRPLYMRKFWYASIEEITAAPRLGRHADAIARQRSGINVAGGPDVWVWLVRARTGNELPIIFQTFSRFAQWFVNPVAEIEILNPYKKLGPIRLAESVPEAPPRSDAHMEVLATGFHTGLQEMRIESWVAVRADPAPEGARVRLRLFDGTGQEIDRVVRLLDSGRSREDLRRHIRGYPIGAEGWIHGFGALVPPGRYATLVELLDAQDTVMASRDQALHFRPDEDDGSHFGMSELVLCDAYLENAPLEGVPPEAVRFARIVIPHPERELHTDQREISVYYEVYGSQIDASGQTQIEVEYEVYPRRGYDPYVGGGAYVDGEIVRPVIRAHFPDERTGRTGGGVVVKGTRLDLEGLAPGDYVLMVRVGDRIAQREASRIASFTLPTDDPTGVSGR